MSKIYCPYAFNAMEITTGGAFSPCCVSSKQFADSAGERYHAGSSSIGEVYASSDRRKWIEQFDVNFKTDCKQCWEVEQGGGESKRLREIKYWKLYYDSLGERVPIIDIDTPLEVLDLKLGNTCNLACATCDPISSSRWNSIIKGFTGAFPVQPQRWQDTDEFWEGLNDSIDHVKKIEIAGGEPFMVKKQRVLLDYLIDNDIAQHVDITWITNSTHYEQDIVDKFKHFKQVRVMVSLDNTHEQFEYMRYPAKWDRAYEIFQKFIELHRENKIMLGLSYTISALNIYRVPDMWQFARDHQIPIFNNLVMQPFHCKNLPNEYKQTVRERLESVEDPAYQVNPAVGKDNWLVNFLMQPADTDEYTQNSIKHRMDLVTRSRPGLGETAFPELVGIWEGL